MKKISFILTAALGVWAFTSCCADKDPMYHRPAEGMIVNEPVLQDNYIILTGGETLDLVTSQPDYGYSAVAQYSAQMSLTPDFNTYANVKLMNKTHAAMQMLQENIAAGFCKLMGFESEDEYNEMYPEGAPFQKIYFRAASELPGVYGSYIVSQNVVSYNYLKPFYIEDKPNKLYVIGDASILGWGALDLNNANVPYGFISEAEDAIDSQQYSGYVKLVGPGLFRFYTELGDWGKDGQLPSIGPLPNDNTNEPIVFEDGSFAGEAVPGKGSWNLTEWNAGDFMYMEVDLSDPNNYTVLFVPAPDYDPEAAE